MSILWTYAFKSLLGKPVVFLGLLTRCQDTGCSRGPWLFLMPQECLMSPNDTQLHHHLALSCISEVTVKTSEKNKNKVKLLKKLLDNYC